MSALRKISRPLRGLGKVLRKKGLRSKGLRAKNTSRGRNTTHSPTRTTKPAVNITKAGIDAVAVGSEEVVGSAAAPRPPAQHPGGARGRRREVALTVSVISLGFVKKFV